MIKVLDSNYDNLQISAHHIGDNKEKIWEFILSDENENTFEGTFTAGSLVKFENDSDLRENVLQSIHWDLESATDMFEDLDMEPIEIMATLVDEYNFTGFHASEVANQLANLVEWFKDLNNEDQEFLKNISDED